MTDHQGTHRRSPESLTPAERLERWRIVGQGVVLAAILALAGVTLFAEGRIQLAAAITGPILGTAAMLYRLSTHPDR